MITYQQCYDDFFKYINEYITIISSISTLLFMGLKTKFKQLE